MRRVAKQFVMLIVFAVAVMAGGCSGDTINAIIARVTVHTGGLVYNESEGIIPAYWKNSALTELPAALGQGGVDAMTGSGSDLYAVGSVLGEVDVEGTTVSAMVPSLWKNGALTILPTLNQAADSLALAVQVSNGSVYAGGGVSTALGVPAPAYWKDGVLQVLETKIKGGLVEGITVDNNDFYAAGFTVDSDGIGDPVYWKNGEMVELPCPVPDGMQLTDGLAYSVSVVNGDIYVIGSLLYNPGNDTRLEKPVYWKNGTIVPLVPLDSDEGAFAWKGIVTEKHVYVVGYVRSSNGIAKPAIWIDGVVQRLSMIDETLVGDVCGIHLMAGHVFVSGYTTRITDPDTEPITVANVPCYWVEGKRVDLPVVEGTENVPAAFGAIDLWQDDQELNRLAASRDSGVAYAVFAQ